MREYDGWTTRCMTTPVGVQAGAYWEGPGRRLLYIDGCAGGTRQDTGVCAVVDRNIRHQITSGLSVLNCNLSAAPYYACISLIYSVC